VRFLGQHVATAETVGKGCEVIVVNPVVLKDHPEEGRHTEEGLYLIYLDRIEEGIDIDLRHEDHAIARDHEGTEAKNLAEDMEERPSWRITFSGGGTMGKLTST